MRKLIRILALCILTVMVSSVAITAFAESAHITILNMETSTARYEETVRLFHLRYPDVEVIVKSEQDPRVISTGMMSKNGDIDLLMTYEMFNPMPTYQYFASGAIEDLSQYPEITQYLPEYVDRFAACTVDGHLIAIPERVYLEAFVVNDPLAEKMGIEVPTGPWTWEDFKAIGEQVLAYNEANGTNYYLFHDNLNAPYVLTGQSGTVSQFLLADTLQLAQGSDTLPHALCCLFLVHTAIQYNGFVLSIPHSPRQPSEGLRCLHTPSCR